MRGPPREGELTPRMCSVPSSSLAASVNSSSISPDSFISKDGRKFRVGDSALFKPLQDSPPFIGIICGLVLGKEDSLSLCVNWLYRPADVKLGKGVLLEAAPNEVFYSFHKDEIPAVSLLHPCKVIFLRKGVELPSGVSAFVCRRVYDIENKCLWWLTDQDYINERQEEVDQLLDKSQLEMHGAVQSGGHSPKFLNGPAITQQPKPGSESVQNSSSSFPSQVKGKKRERADQGSEPVKREHSLKADDDDSFGFRPEQMLKSEIAKITDKGGLVDFEGVEKLLQLMQPKGADKKIDMASRIMLVDVIAVTDRFDCLEQFVLLKGLPVLDEWLREVHKGKIGDGSSPKECDKSNDFLLALLRALDKLPVNLQALQTCNVGKSVNHLRAHKNYEIQKKARTLVDAWKKRVQAEMNIIEAKSGSFRGGSWPTKSVVAEVSRRIGSYEAGVKCSGIQSKTTPLELGSVEIAKYSTPSTDSEKLPASVTTSGYPSTMDPISITLVGGETSDVRLTTIKEEKSSNSRQSQNNSQSCSSDHANTGTSSFQEDVRSSTTLSVNKISSGGSCSRKLSNCLHGSGAAPLVQKETGKITSLRGNMASEKVSTARTTSERGPDVPIVDNGNSHRLIVRLPNTGRSPARSSLGGSPEDPTSTFSKVSPPSKSDKLDHHDRKVKVKSDAQRATRASNTSMVLSHGMPGSEEVNTFSASPLCDRLRKDGEDSEKLMEASKATCLSSRIAPKPGKSYEASFSSMNALIESCAKLSEASASTSVGDDIGMNLLASVAAGEISRTDVSPLGSPAVKSPASEDSCSGNNVKSRQSDEDSSQSENQPNNGENGGAMVDQGNSVDVLSGFLHHSMPETGECAAQLNASSADLLQNDAVFMSDGKACNLSYDSSVAASSVDATKAGDVEGEGAYQILEQRKSVAIQLRNTSTSNSKLKSRSPLLDEDGNIQNSSEKPTGNSVVIAPEPTSLSAKIEKEVNKEPPYCSSSEIHGEAKNAEHKQTGSCNLAEQKPLHKIGERNEGIITPPPGFCNVLGMDLKAENADDMKIGRNTMESKKENLEVGSSVVGHASECTEDDSDRKEVLGHCPAGSGSHEESHAIPVQDTEDGMKSSGFQLDGVEAHGAEEPAHLGNPMSLSAAGSDAYVKLDFDLNEGFPVDDGYQGELVKSSTPGNSSSIHFPCPLPISTSTMSGSLHASITVAAAAKGPFVPPESLLRSKGEFGWKGSAATSAFRPAEPRKVLEMPLNTTNVPLLENSTNKQGRPLLDIDLNVPDQRDFEDLASQRSGHMSCLESRSHDRSGGGLDFDLNRVDESLDMGQSFVSTSCKLETLPLPGRSTLSGGFSNSELNAARGFDLNDGPGLDEVVADMAWHTKSSMPFLSTVPAIRMNNSELGTFSSWFPPSNSYSTFALPSMLPGRGEQSYPVVPATASQRTLGPSPAGMPMPSLPSFNPEIFRRPVLSSCPAPGFPPPSAFQYPGLPFETNFPFSSNSYTACSTAYVDASSSGPLCFPNISSQLVGPAGMLSTPYTRSYVMSLPGGTSNGGPEGRKFGSQGLDLNAGPGGTDVEWKEDRLPSALRQLPVNGSQALLAEEQLRLYQMAGGVSKRKEPDGGWDGDRVSYKQS